jgi:hypothetical protein
VAPDPSVALRSSADTFARRHVALEPSYRSAAAAGVWSALGWVSFGIWLEHAKPDSTLSHNLAWLVVLAVFLYLPGYFLVVGASATRFGRNWISDPAERQRYLAVVKRLLVWLVSGGIASIVLARLLPSL